MSRIRKIVAREVLDSRGRPTVEAEVHTTNFAVGTAIAPSGASTGKSEAVERRDGDPARYGGLGVLGAVADAVDLIGPALAGMAVAEQEQADRRLIELDGTPNKGRLGANAILAVSMAIAHAAARERGEPLHRHIRRLAKLPEAEAVLLPMPMMNILSGGLHAGGNIEMQDFLAVPLSAGSMRRAMEMLSDVYRAAGAELKSRGYECRLTADEGGFGPALRSNDEAVDVLTAAIMRAGLRPGVDVAIALDVASSHFFDAGVYRLEGQSLTSDQMVERLAGWVDRFPVVSIEDGLAEDDWAGWATLTKRLGSRAQLVGDDLFTTNPQRLARGIVEGCGNAVLVKMNQIGTLTETLEVIRSAKAAGYRTVVSARSGETEDVTMVHLAIGASAGQIKIGSITRSERLAKYNEMLRIEHRAGEQARLAPWA